MIPFTSMSSGFRQCTAVMGIIYCECGHRAKYVSAILECVRNQDYVGYKSSVMKF